MQLPSLYPTQRTVFHSNQLTPSCLETQSKLHHAANRDSLPCPPKHTPHFDNKPSPAQHSTSSMDTSVYRSLTNLPSPRFPVHLPSTLLLHHQMNSRPVQTNHSTLSPPAVFHKAPLARTPQSKKARSSRSLARCRQRRDQEVAMARIREMLAILRA